MNGRTVHDDLATARHALDDLTCAVRVLGAHFGNSLDMRRVRGDVDRISASLDALSECAPRVAGRRGTAGASAPVTIPDREYDPQFFRGADDEGLGAFNRHSP